MNSRSPSGRAWERTLDLLAQRPAEPDVHRGYLDLAGAQEPEPTGRIQSFWLSGLGSSAYDGVIRFGAGLRDVLGPVVGSKIFGFLDVPKRLRLQPGTVVLDVGCGPGNITRSMAKAVGDEGLVVGLDVSPAMLDRAVRNTNASNVVYMRADAVEPPLRDATVDAVNSSACLQLLPDPQAAVDEMQRVLRPGGRISLAVPSAINGMLRPVTNFVQQAGQVRLFEPGELPGVLLERAFDEVEDHSVPGMQIVSATKKS